MQACQDPQAPAAEAHMPLPLVSLSIELLGTCYACIAQHSCVHGFPSMVDEDNRCCFCSNVVLSCVLSSFLEFCSAHKACLEPVIVAVYPVQPTQTHLVIIIFDMH